MGGWLAGAEDKSGGSKVPAVARTMFLVPLSPCPFHLTSSAAQPCLLVMQLTPASVSCLLSDGALLLGLQGVDIFKKDYLFVPIHDALHWSLVIVCHPGELARASHSSSSGGTEPQAEAGPSSGARADEGGGSSIGRKTPCMLHLDSMSGEPPAHDCMDIGLLTACLQCTSCLQ